MHATVRPPPAPPAEPSSLVKWSVDRPKWVVVLTALVAFAFAAAFPFATVDTNPKNMLPPTSEVRVWNDSVDRLFALHEDTIMVAVSPQGGALTPGSLERLRQFNDDVLALEGVVKQDVVSLFTTDNITVSDDSLRIAPLLAGRALDAPTVDRLRKQLFDNPLFVDRLISRDGASTAVYIPIETGADGAALADEIHRVAGKHFQPQEIAVTGDPVARDRFGAEMFKMMGLFAPIAGALMMGLIVVMFRSWWLAGVMMMAAMAAILCSLGGAIMLGFPVHIMSSMAPVFLMAIATDSIHIYNEFFQRYRPDRDRAAVIRETMAAVARPVKYTALATAAGFAVLLFMEVVPVRVFGGIVVVGTLVLRFLSFTLIPACLALIPLPARPGGDGPSKLDESLSGLANWTLRHPKALLAVAVALLAGSLYGMSQIVVNNNMLHWFKPGNEIRQADELISRRLGGAAPAYLVVDTGRPDGVKDPRVLRVIERLQRELVERGLAGATLSVADYVKRVHRVLTDDRPQSEVVPDEPALIGQYLLAFSMASKPSDLNRVVDYPFQQANIILQLKSWDAFTMQRVSEHVAQFMQREKPGFDIKPAGAAYFNLVWNQEVLKDMIRGFGIALIVVFLILAIDFSSLKWAGVAYIPLLLTVALVFGVVGLAGKDFDMPVAVLSCLSLGMAIDFAIHFVSRYRERWQHEAAHGKTDIDSILRWTITWPGKGIVRNAALFAIAFSVMIFAPLTPYITVGAFILAMMVLSAFATITLLPALIKTLKLEGH